jgi:hypothetical protein
MSTVIEVIAAAHAGLPVLGLSAITNAATGGPDQAPDTIEEVLANAARRGREDRPPSRAAPRRGRALPGLAPPTGSSAPDAAAQAGASGRDRAAPLATPALEGGERRPARASP